MKGQVNNNYGIVTYLQDDSEKGEKVSIETFDVPPLNTARHSCSSFVHKDHLFVCFGIEIGSEQKYLSTIEVAKVSELLKFQHNGPLSLSEYKN